MTGARVVDRAMGLKATGLDIDLLGMRVRTIVHDPDLAGYLVHLLEDVRVEPTEGPVETFEITGGDLRRDWVLRHNDKGILQTESRTRLVEGFFSTLNELVLDDFRGVAIHAGVVARGSRALAIPGRSGAGKSTLTAACVAAGFAYVSDEALCIDRLTGDVVRYPRPLMLTATSSRLVGTSDSSPVAHQGKIALSPIDLGGETSSVSLRLADVVLAERGAALSLEPASPSDVIPELLRRSFSGYEDRTESFELLAKTTRDCQAWCLRYSDAVEAAALLRRTLPFSQPAP
jgi:hypothetical protein